MITKIFSITASPCMIQKIERFLVWLHWNSRWGHSATIAIDCDGDGEDKVTVEGADLEGNRAYVDHVKSKTKSVEWITCD